MDKLGIRRELSLDFDTVLSKLPDALKREGFGVLTEIDVKATLKTKLDVEFPRYRILGACNPRAAHQVLSADPEIGLLLPCNVIVYEKDGKTVVSAFNPMQVAGFLESGEIRAVAEDIGARLGRVIASL